MSSTPTDAPNADLDVTRDPLSHLTPRLRAALGIDGIDVEAARRSALRLTVTRTKDEAGLLQPDLGTLNDHGLLLLATLVALASAFTGSGKTPISAPVSFGAYSVLLPLFADLYPVSPQHPSYRSSIGDESVWDTYITNLVMQTT